MQFNCDASNNTLTIKKVRATDYPDFKSLDDVPGVLKEDLGIEYIHSEHNTVVKDGQLPKTVASCNLSDAKNQKTVVTLSLSEVHIGRVRGLCGAASGPAYEVLIGDKIIARFASDKDQCYPIFNPLDINRMEYSWGRIGLCRVPENSSANIQNLSVRWEGELCLYGTPDAIIDNQEIMKGFEQELFDKIGLDEAHRQLHIYKNKRILPAQFEATKQSYQTQLDRLKQTMKIQQTEIDQLQDELKQAQSNLKAETSKSFWQRVFNKND